MAKKNHYGFSTNEPREIQKIYHGTNFENMKKILNSGAIIPMGNPAFVYLTRSKYEAAVLAALHNNKSSKLIVIEIDATRLHQETFEIIEEKSIYVKEPTVCYPSEIETAHFLQYSTFPNTFKLEREIKQEKVRKTAEDLARKIQEEMEKEQNE